MSSLSLPYIIFLFAGEGRVFQTKLAGWKGNCHRVMELSITKQQIPDILKRFRRESNLALYSKHFKLKNFKNLMVPFYGWGSVASTFY